MTLVIAVLIVVGVVVFVAGIRVKDVPQPEPPSPTAHLEERKARIYDNLRDLQFEYRVGKLSDEDYQRTKLGLQKELAAVLAEVDQVLGKLPAAKPEPAPARDARQCPHCGAKFERELKFCGECGKSMQAEQSA
jgi:NADH pyrophosphatase NudC (nudix superfamily)